MGAFSSGFCTCPCRSACSSMRPYATESAGARVPAAGTGAPGPARQVVPLPDRACPVARADAAQRPAGRLPDPRPPGAVGRLRRGHRLVLHPRHVAGVRDRALVPGHRGYLHAWTRHPRARPRHGVQDQVAQPLLPGADVAAHLVELPRVRDEPHLPPPLHALPGGRPRGGAADRPAPEAAADTAAAHRQRAGDVPDHRGHRAHGHSPLPPRPDQYSHQRVDRGAVQASSRGGAQGGALRPPDDPVSRRSAGGVCALRRLVDLDRVDRFPVLRQLVGRAGRHADARRADGRRARLSHERALQPGSTRSRRSCTGA